MFEELFNYPAVLSRHLKAPLVSERKSYLAHRARNGTSRGTLLRIARELLVIVREMDLDSQVLISTEAIESAAERWARRQKRQNRAHGLQHSRRLFSQIAYNWLQFLGRLKEPEVTLASYTPMIQKFSLFMQCERGLSAATICNYVWYVRQFLGWFYEQEHSLDKVSVLDVDTFVLQHRNNWSRVTSACCLDVDTFVLQHRNNWSRVTSACCAKSLRAFFRYAEKRGGINSLHKGPHSLRHACAAHLVSEGFSLKEIGDHLGHRSAFATRIYAKVDLAGLREVANFDIGGVL